MKEDEVLSKIGAHVRDERGPAVPPQAGRRAEGAPTGEENPPAILDGEAAERIARRLVPEQDAKMIPFRRRMIPYGAPLALAAAVLLFVMTRTGESGPQLPGYAVTATGEQAMRGDTAKSTRLHLAKGQAGRFELVARPETAVGDAKVVAYAFAMIDGEPTALDAKVDVSKDGAVRITGESRLIGTANELRVVVGTPEAIGKYEGALDRAKSGSGDSRVRVLSIAIDRD
jgi:hypothetical protein